MDERDGNVTQFICERGREGGGQRESTTENEIGHIIAPLLHVLTDLYYGIQGSLHSVALATLSPPQLPEHAQEKETCTMEPVRTIHFSIHPSLTLIMFEKLIVTAVMGCTH